MKVLELFSGIGGMHFAIQATGVKSDIVAVEINNFANLVYRHNFPQSKLLQKNIISLKLQYFSKLQPEMLLMSPPCQPFTRVGLQKDLEDSRSDPLKHILSVLPHLTSLRYILVENVKGFERSEARTKLTNCLEELNFELREFLISPTQVGVPNTRTRYYLLAKRRPLTFNFKNCGIMEKLPNEASDMFMALDSCFPILHTIKDVLETDDIKENIYQEHLIPQKLLEKRTRVMDIVTGESCRSCCFTKAYGRYVEGTGSVFCPYDQAMVDKVFANKLSSSSSTTTIDQESVKFLCLRYFTPREIARLMSFPESFQFPPSVTSKQAYQLLGNSINIKVVALLLKLMFFEPNT